MKRLSSFVSLAVAGALAAAALAHPGHEHDLVQVGAAPAHPFVTGFAHPFGGLDHILAMLAVGLWAGQRGGKALWLWPVSFVGVMLVGAGLGMAGIALPAVEPAIASSIVVLGLLVALSAKLPIAAGAALVGAFALFHGNAHGLEAPTRDAALYMAGFAVATAVLHGIGLALGIAATRLTSAPLIRIGGAAGAVAGAVLLIG